MTDLSTAWDTPDAKAPPREAFHVEYVIDPFTRKKTIGMVRHASNAYVAKWHGLDQLTEKQQWQQWQQIANLYLRAVAQRIGVAPGHPEWMPVTVCDALDTPTALGSSGKPADELRGLAWLEVSWDLKPKGPQLDQGVHAHGSFWVGRRQGDTDQRTLVMLAGCQREGLMHGSDMGLRVALHVCGDQARVHGLTLCGLTDDHALHSLPDGIINRAALFELASQIRSPIGTALGRTTRVWINNLERVRAAAAPSTRVRANGYGLRWPDGHNPLSRPRRPRVFDFDVELELAQGTPQVVRIDRNEYAGSEAAGAARTSRTWRLARVFLADAASQGGAGSLAERRASRDAAALLRQRREVLLPLGTAGALTYSANGQSVFETRGVRVDAVGNGETVLTTPSSVVIAKAALTASQPDEFWSDEQASVEAHMRAAELFARFDAYGIDPQRYFRFARLPLVQRARAAMRWAPDGELPNAEVRPYHDDPDPKNVQHDNPTATRLQLMVKYGSADPMQRRQVPLLRAADDSTVGLLRADGQPRTRAQYLGVASDARWAWHEFGHVLNYASTGELEFPFAHSAGDALGAIAADPLSQLASAEDPEAELRFASYPWIEVPGRSHGRPALEGYCWCGQRNQVRLNFSAPLQRHHHGYYEEQMLSSSLFRLYRSLGGDTRSRGPAPSTDPIATSADEAMRLGASDYCIYLIMRAISMLGPDTIAPARTVDQFVSALIDADLGTGDWDVRADWPFDRDPRTVKRRGGRVHKVIRWAFERQGLYATPDPEATADTFGLPPPVDVYVPDLRPLDARHPDPGGYAPVPLQWAAAAPWQAALGAVYRERNHLVVALANRGAKPAVGVTLRVWWGRDAADGSLTWTHHTQHDTCPTIGKSTVSARVAWPQGASATGAVWVLVNANAPADPSNLPQGDRPPTDKDALLELVAHDNNLALRKLA